ncbi:MAG TPA: hypothetical protein VGS06_33095 [Streptosporangiaceae bacterium]|nr:hypothetical protein [Streptosporangiaceae bacterium]
MFTVIDQAWPWLIPSSTFAATIQPHPGPYASRNGTGKPAAQPATSRCLRAYRAASGPTARLAAALAAPNAMMNEKMARYPDRWNTRAPIKLVVAHSRPTIPPTNAFTRTSSVNCGQFACSPSRTGRSPAPPAVFTCLPWTGATPARRSPAIRGLPGGLRPVAGAAVQDRQPADPAGGEQAGAGHRPLSVLAHDCERPVRQPGRAGGGGQGGQGGQLAVDGAWQVPGCPFGVLADIQHTPAVRTADEAWPEQRDGLGREPGGLPGADAAVEFAGQVVVADLQACLGKLAAVLPGIEHHHQRAPRVGEPAEPGRERRAQRDRHRAGDVGGGEARDRAGIDHRGPGPGQLCDVRPRSAREAPGG